MEYNQNLKYLEDQYGHMNANTLLAIKEDLESMDLQDIYKEVGSHNYPIKNYKTLTKEALISEIVIWKADNDVPVEADELEAVLNNDINYLNEDTNY